MLPSKVPEILAPAGGRPQFFAALNAGADAVYLGLKQFNARARAENFTEADLRELVPLAHRYGMKILVTVNILIKDLELSHLIETLATLEESGVHAIIVQDLAVARVARSYFPRLRLHASTQMAIHNLAGVKQAWRYGFKRVVLARELTAPEIKTIREAVPEREMELEAFCHGSLCYSYSGLCFFSGASDARSGNRGECAYTCRQPYKILNEPGHGFLFSMRDLDSSQALDTLVGTGVDTLKIEGRKKDAQYVATVVKLYRHRLDEIYGRNTLRASAPPEAQARAGGKQLRDDLALSFHRNPTTFFLKGRYHENVIDLDNPTHLGIRIGEIRKVLPHAVQVRTEIGLERFDGLRVASSAQVFHAKPQHGDTEDSTAPMLKKFAGEDARLALREMRVGQAWTPVARAGSLVEISWPEDEPLPRAGDILFKVRSADLKRRVEKITVPPPDARLRALSFVDLRVRLIEGGKTLRLQAFLSKLGEPLCEAGIELPKEISRGGSDLRADLAAVLSLFGDQGYALENFVFEGEAGQWFVPRSKLKELKQALASSLPASYAAFTATRRQKALAEVLTPATPPPPNSERRFSVKTDRLETLQDLAGFLARHPEFPLGDVIFEPKRAFLPALDPGNLTEALQGFARATGAPIVLAFPMVIRRWDEPLLRRWLTHAAGAGLTRYELGNVSALEYLDEWGLRDSASDLASDFTLYAMNTEATLFWAERGIRTVTLSLEDDLTNLTSHLSRWPWERGVRPRAILFKDTPLFIAEACSLTALHNGCPGAKVCGYRTLEIENPAGERFFVAHESCKSIVYAKEAFSLTHRQGALHALGVRDFRLDFLTRPYSGETLERVLTAAWRGEKVPATHTSNFDRSLL